MLDTIDRLASFIGYICLLIAIMWVVSKIFETKNRDIENLPLTNDEKPRKSPLASLQNSLEEKERSFAGLSFDTNDRRYSIDFQKRLGHIDCFIENAMNRKNGIGTGDFIHLVFSREDLDSVGRWSQISQDEHQESLNKMIADRENTQSHGR